MQIKCGCPVSITTIALIKAINGKGRFGGGFNFSEANADFTIGIALEEEEEFSFPCGCVCGIVSYKVSFFSFLPATTFFFLTGI